MSHDRDDLAALLDDLRVTLDELEQTLDTDGTGERADRRRPPAREPPRGSDVVRFTEEYTIPTVIAILETTVQSLELLRGVLRLANPERRLRDDSDGPRLDSVDRRVVDGTERALDDLRRVLTGTEEPTDPVARDVFRDARELSAEIESLLTDAREDASRSPSRRHSADERQSVVIPVDDELEAGHDTEEEDENDSGVEIDVDAELESIRDEVREESAATGGAETSSDSGETDDTATDGRENGDGDESA